MTKREAAKAERRERIAKAVIDLTQQSGLDGFSMRDLAKQAGVSQATPFNLFGSKAEVISHIFEADLQNFRDALDARPSEDALERLFDMICTSMSYFRQKQALYRALYMSFRGTANNQVHKCFSESRQKLFVEMVEAAKSAKLLRSDVSSRMIARALYHQWEGILFDWVKGSISLDRMEHELCFGFAALLSGFTTPKKRPHLQLKMLAYQKEVEGIA